MMSSNGNLRVCSVCEGLFVLGLCDEKGSAPLSLIEPSSHHKRIRYRHYEGYESKGKGASKDIDSDLESRVRGF